MLSFPETSVYQGSKCYFTYGRMPHVDPTQPPSKGKPWATLQSLDFVHRVDLIMPQAHLQAVQEKVSALKQPPEFKRVIMTLGQMLEPDFFKEYIKIGDILMLSEGRVGSDNVFTLRDGKLTLFLDRETYERAGLVGQPHGAKGKRGLKPRWVVEFDLKADSMWHGKKGFQRLLHASQTALSSPVTWLFCNLSKTPENDPLEVHFPTKYTSTPGVQQDVSVALPPFDPHDVLLDQPHWQEAETFATELYEWLSLVRLRSPRIETGDTIDPYLSRYRVPSDPEQQPPTASICKVTWTGFMSSKLAREMLIEVLGAIPSASWLSLSFSTYPNSKALSGEGAECTFFRPPKSGGEYMLWEVKSHE